jgi:hypothetical protein
MYTENYNTDSYKFFFLKDTNRNGFHGQKKKYVFIYILTAIIGAKFHSNNAHYQIHIRRKNDTQAVKINTSLETHNLVVCGEKFSSSYVPYSVRMRTRVRSDSLSGI